MSQGEAGEDATSPGINVNAPILLQSPAGTEHSGAVILTDLMVGGACDSSSSATVTMTRNGGGNGSNTLRGGAGGGRDAVTSGGDVMDPAMILPHLRQQRANLVPSYDIFKFVYKVMIEYFGRSRLI